MRKAWKIVIWIVGVVAVLALAICLTVVIFIRSPFPKTRGTVELAGLSEPVEILRDEDGVPHIFAANVGDLLFAQGYVHAQDRFWQMEFWRRTGAGRLSELFGESLVETDRFLRTMGFARIAEQEYRQLDTVSRAYLEAYANGVNAYISSRKPRRLGLEFALLSLQGVELEIEEWEPVHTLTWAKMMAYDLSANMGTEARNIDLFRQGGLPLLEPYIAPYRDDMPYIVSMDELAAFREYWGVDPADFPVRVDTRQTVAQAGREGIGSNNWVISPGLTENGHPLVVNDMHLSVQMPSIWYEVGLHIQSEDGPGSQASLDLRGYSFAGVPWIITGQNAHVGWGVTNVGGDVQDYFVEKLNPEDPDQYWSGNRWADMEVRTEIIHVQGQDEPEYHVVRRTERGPILSDLSGFAKLGGYDVDGDGAFPERLGARAVSLSWTALEPSSLLSAVTAANLSTNITEFRDALRMWDVPGQNFVYADTEGNIGYQTTGSYPVRTHHSGQAPAAGYDEQGWDGRVPFDMNPGIINPEKGFIVTANNPVAPPEYEHLIGTHFANGYRARQITRRIEALGDGITADDMRDVHADVYSLTGQEIARALSGITAETAYDEWFAHQATDRNPLSDEVESDRDEEITFLTEALALFTDWDYGMDIENSGAAAFGYVYLRIMHNTMEDNFAPGRDLGGGAGGMAAVFAYLLGEPDHEMWDNRYTPAPESMEDVFALSLAEGLFQARDELGGKTEEWQWGDVHTITFYNGTLGQSGIGLIENLFNRGPYPANGSSNTVNVAAWRIDDPFAVVHASSQRSILDPVEPSNSLFVHPTGQSGHPYNRHYDDFIDDWTEVRYHPGRWTYEEAAESAGRKRLVLEVADR